MCWPICTIWANLTAFSRQRLASPKMTQRVTVTAALEPEPEPEAGIYTDTEQTLALRCVGTNIRELGCNAPVWQGEWGRRLPAQRTRTCPIANP